MPKTPPAISLIGIALTVLAIATGSWLSSTKSVEATIDWPTDIAVDVRDALARVDPAQVSAPGDGDCAGQSARPTEFVQSNIASGISTT